MTDSYKRTDAADLAYVQRFKTGTGVVLLALGVSGAIWIAHGIITLGTAPQDIPLISMFLAFDTEARTIVTASGNIELPKGLYFAVAFFLYILALAIVGGVTKVLITSGANLFQQELTPLLNRFRDEIRRFKEYLESRGR